MHAMSLRGKATKGAEFQGVLVVFLGVWYGGDDVSLFLNSFCFEKEAEEVTGRVRGG